MSNTLDNMIQEAYKCCDEIERAGVIKIPLQKSLRECLRMEFLNFLLYLSLSDGTMCAEESAFIKEKTGADVNAVMAASVLPAAFAGNIPTPFKYFVLTDAGRKISGGDNNRAKRLADTYARLGQELIASNRDISDIELASLTRYCNMLDDYLREFGLYTPERRIKRESILQDGMNAPAEKKPLTEENVEEILSELNELIGLDSVKEDVNTIVNLLRIQKIRKERGMKQPGVSKHLVFVGNPGTGKTTVARMLAKIYNALGVLSQGQLVEVDRSGLVSGYVGQTAMKTKDVIDSAIDGILFIDEAYTLTANRGENDFGQEAVDTILKAMEDNRDNLIVIVAGYPALMEEFLNSNPGLRSRFNKYILFEDYTPEQEVSILESMAKKQEYELDEEARKEAVAFFTERIDAQLACYANARDARNYLEKAIANQADRIVKLKELDDVTIRTLLREDLPKKL
ncbi:MAG: AAA family ATPase [Alistipes sp.]|nr:AAA family ATPase [Alistipes sp.]